MWALFAAPIFLAAALLFVAEPMVAKTLLPVLGGSPAVWNVCVLVFQTLLLFGYAWAHLLARLPGRAERIVHAMVLVAAACTLPLDLSARPGDELAATAPTSWLLVRLLTTVAPCFFAMAATGSLVQRWFSRTGRDPYPLYAASNAGSLVGMLAFPFVVERTLDVHGQTTLFGAGFLATALLVGGAALASVKATASDATTTDGPPPRPRELAQWLLWSALPSSLLLGCTQHITTDVATVPLLWMIPLALYLATFIIAFARPRAAPPALSLLTAALLTALTVIALREAKKPELLVGGLHLATFFCGALLCHLRLAASRPAPRHLTTFYLVIALGGVIGSACNALLAPVLVDRVLEYPLALAALALLLHDRSSPGVRASWRTPAVFVAAVTALVALLRNVPVDDGPALLVVKVVLPPAACFLLLRRPRHFAAGIAALFAASFALPAAHGKLLEVERTFFGVHRVAYDVEQRFVLLLHGTTLHGAEARDDDGRAPTSYYHPSGPAGALFAALHGTRGAAALDVGIIGLGVGSLAAYARPNDHFTFFEIDPAVVRIARTPTWFRFLSRAGQAAQVVVADGRLGLRTVAPGSLDVVVVDAFSSDAIPVHLLTREALRMYVERLKPGGLVVLHVSNDVFDLPPVVDALARAEGLVMAAATDGPPADEHAAQGKQPSQWAVVARSTDDLTLLGATGLTWNSFVEASAPVWTDAFSPVVSALR
ncbi:MAG: fused MFS/spermidine synthase [Deltaproteobacteria bacterium]|nr:fused MFS/spermidine synthase [Deltaproteobacteria bacterium]